MVSTTAQVDPVKRQELTSRRLKDIAELLEKPYPGIKLHVNDQNLFQACLVLSPESQRSLHCRIEFPENYPLKAPKVSIQSRVDHPNIYGGYICASILNDASAYTSAYTLKCICIQLLSFFNSDTIEQDYGDVVDLGRFREDERQMSNWRGSTRMGALHGYSCEDCGFGVRGALSVINAIRKSDQEAVKTPSGCPIAQVPLDVCTHKFIYQVSVQCSCFLLLQVWRRLPWSYSHAICMAHANTYSRYSF